MLYHPYFSLGRSFLLAILLLSAGRAHAADDLPRIHHIVIHGLERTDEQVIRRELLFAVGDVLDSTRVAEQRATCGACCLSAKYRFAYSTGPKASK